MIAAHLPNPSADRPALLRAAGRYLGFTKAADELNVTQAAVSRQVKSLEKHLGLKLFRRLNRTLLLMDAGQLYLPLQGLRS